MATDEEREQWCRDAQQRARALVGRTVTSVVTESSTGWSRPIDGESDVLAVMTLDDGTTLHVSWVYASNRLKVEPKKSDPKGIEKAVLADAGANYLPRLKGLPPRLTKAQLEELNALAKGPQKTYGRSRARVQNNLFEAGYVRFENDGYDCVLTEAGFALYLSQWEEYGKLQYSWTVRVYHDWLVILSRDMDREKHAYVHDGSIYGILGALRRAVRGEHGDDEEDEIRQGVRT